MVIVTIALNSLISGPGIRITVKCILAFLAVIRIPGPLIKEFSAMVTITIFPESYLEVGCVHNTADTLFITFCTHKEFLKHRFHRRLQLIKN